MLSFNARIDRFVQAPQPEGLDATPDQVRLFLKDPRLLDLWDQLTVKGPGGNNNSAGVNQHTPEPAEQEAEEVITDSVSNDQNRPNKHGNSRQYALRKLRENAPEIHAEVMTGKISPNAGMVEAGFRLKQITIPLNLKTPEGSPGTALASSTCFFRIADGDLLPANASKTVVPLHPRVQIDGTSKTATSSTPCNCGMKNRLVSADFS